MWNSWTEACVDEHAVEQRRHSAIQRNPLRRGENLAADKNRGQHWRRQRWVARRHQENLEEDKPQIAGSVRAPSGRWVTWTLGICIKLS